MLHEMETTYEPYNDKNDGELEELFDADDSITTECRTILAQHLISLSTCSAGFYL